MVLGLSQRGGMEERVMSDRDETRADPEFSADMVECFESALVHHLTGHEGEAGTPEHRISILRALRAGGHLREERREITNQDCTGLLKFIFTPIKKRSGNLSRMRDVLAEAGKRGLLGAACERCEDLHRELKNARVTINRVVAERDELQRDLAAARQEVERLTRDRDLKASQRDGLPYLPLLKEAEKILADYASDDGDFWKQFCNPTGTRDDHIHLMMRIRGAIREVTP